MNTTELKFEVQDETTLKVIEGDNEKLWTLETLEHSLVQVEKDIADADSVHEERITELNNYKQHFLGLVEEAKKLGIKTRDEVKAEKEAPDTSDNK